MKMPEDSDDRSGLTPTAVMALLAGSLFVALILVTVLFLNERAKGKKAQESRQAESIQAAQGTEASVVPSSGIDGLPAGSGLHPDDFDFWDMYPEDTPTPRPMETPAAEETTAPEDDPSTDGKHTLVQYADGKEEWVLISPNLPKHEYDFTKLVCQSDLMKYYENGKQTSYVGVDLSKFNGDVDFGKVKQSGVDFVMLRVGARGYGTGQLIADESFSKNFQQATEAGLEVGVYFSSQAISEAEAREEAAMVLQSLGEYRIHYPVAFDMELVKNDAARIDALTREEKTAIAKAFLEPIAAAGYNTMIYGNKEWLIKEIDMSKLTAYDIWLSQSADIPDYPYRFAMWQYSFEGSVEGITGYANMNICFINYMER